MALSKTDSAVWVILCIAAILFNAVQALGIYSKFPRDNKSPQGVGSERLVHLQALNKIARPVLEHASTCTLNSLMAKQLNGHPPTAISCTSYRVSAAFGRTMAGIAPWLELPVDGSSEGQMRDEYITLARKAFHNIFLNRTCGDYVHWDGCTAVIVEAAYIGHTMLRMPKLFQTFPRDLVEAIATNLPLALTLDDTTFNNHVNFPSMVEAGLWLHNLSSNTTFIRRAFGLQESWYAGDGAYADGPHFHFDQYNGFVMHPMLVDVASVCAAKGNPLGEKHACLLRRMQRWAVVQERMIHADGTYFLVGRSQHYRFGAFQVLGQLALQHNLPVKLPVGKVRSALTGLISRFMSNPDNFVGEWLSAGVNGHQPGMMNPYGDTGALYLICLGLVQLGLPATDPFWTDPAMACTQAQIWTEGKDIGLDEAYDGPVC